MYKIKKYEQKDSFLNEKCSLPNDVISYIGEEKMIYIIENNEIISIYNTTSINEECILCNDIFNVIESITIDDKQIEKVSAYTFNEVGEHKVVYKLYNCDDIVNCPVFKNATALTYIKLPKNMRVTYDYSLSSYSHFSNCINLKNIDILYNNHDVSFSFTDDMFYNCQSLTEFKFPKCFYGIGDVNFFKNCDNLKKLIFQNDGYCQYSLSYYPFSGLTNLEEVIVENGCDIAILNAFKFNTKIKKVFIGDKVRQISNKRSYTNSIKAFNEYTLESIVVDENNPYYDSRENCNCIIKTDANEVIYAAINYTIPSSVEKISTDVVYFNKDVYELPENIKEMGDWMFSSVRNKTLYFGKKFEKFGANCFYYVYNITIYFKNTTPPIVDETCFNDGGVNIIYYPKGSDYSSLMNHPNLVGTNFIEYEF